MEELLPSAAPSSTLTKARALCCAFLLSLVPLTQCTGSINSFGTFSVYYASYYYQSHPHNPMVRNCFFVVFSTACVIEGLAFAVVSGVMLTGAYFSPLVIGDPYVFAAACSLGIGYGSGGCFYMCFLESWKHFPTTWRGKVMGLIAAVYGFAPIIWNSLFTFLCNPENRPADIQLHVGETEYNLFGAEVADRVNWVSAVLGFSMLGCYVVAIAGFPMKDAVPAVSSEDLISAENKPPEGLCPDLNTAVKTWAFWSMLINMFCGITYGLFIVNAYKNYGLTKYSNDQLMSSIGSIAAVFGGISRVLFSSAMDHFSFRLVFGLNVSLQLAATAGITYALETSLALYCICVSIGFSTLAGVFPAFIMESSRLFGHK